MVYYITTTIINQVLTTIIGCLLLLTTINHYNYQLLTTDKPLDTSPSCSALRWQRAARRAGKRRQLKLLWRMMRDRGSEWWFDMVLILHLEVDSGSE